MRQIVMQQVGISVYVSSNSINQQAVKYTLATLFFNKGINFSFNTVPTTAQLTIGVSNESNVKLSTKFYDQLSKGIFNNAEVLNDRGLVVVEDGSIDYISTIFYLINSIQEYNSSDVDEFGRFKYTSSIQYKLNCIDQNLVQQLIDDFISSVPQLAALTTTPRKSKFFLTHDIDSVYGAIKEDGYYALKHMQIGEMFRLILNAAIAQPDWLNMDKIMAIEDEYSFRSTFYWLLIKNQQNSDYHFNSAKIQSAFNQVKAKGWQNGLHKSVGDSNFNQEIKTFGSMPAGNRFHYLKFALPNGYDSVEQTGIKLDTSLGFSEVLGFRNSYGLPFMPYNLKEERAYNFIEVPQLIMDRTFFRDRKSVAEIKNTLFDFIEKNKYNCVFTINWHNNFFTELKYAGYSQLYKDILAYFRDNQTECITQSQLIKDYYKPELYNA